VVYNDCCTNYFLISSEIKKRITLQIWPITKPKFGLVTSNCCILLAIRSDLQLRNVVTKSNFQPFIWQARVNALQRNIMKDWEKNGFDIDKNLTQNFVAVFASLKCHRPALACQVILAI